VADWPTWSTATAANRCAASAFELRGRSGDHYHALALMCMSSGHASFGHPALACRDTLNPLTPLAGIASFCWARRPTVSGLCTGSDFQVVVGTADAYPISYPFTHNTQNHTSYTTYSPRPLLTTYHRRRPGLCVLAGRLVASGGHRHLQWWSDLEPSRGAC
jgi:hypothetical protein